jgi:butyrate kinase
MLFLVIYCVSVITQELESAHMAAAEELESLYEKRLKVEAEKMKQLAGAKDDLQFRSEETVSKLKESHREDLRVRRT